jgi:nicotinate-nucleotide adenylyltransferase
LKPERIGLMGGSFNPIHLMHVAVARKAMEEAALGKVLFLPTGSPPHKREGLAKASQRLDMVKLALAQEPDFSPSDIEMNRTGTVYTVDTLILLRRQIPKAEFYYIIGEDTLYDLVNWREPEKVFQMCRFLVCPRPGKEETAAAQVMRGELKRRGASFTFLKEAVGDISSTAIRAHLALGEEPEGLSPAVMEYIRVMGLYGAKESPPGFAAFMDRLMGSMNMERFAHTLCVAYAARHLAKLHGEDEEKAAIAGLLHDCAKGMDITAMQAYVREHKMKVDESILSSGALLHAAVGAHMARNVYGVSQEQVLSAIECHTLGKVPMTPLEMIVYLADKIEPDREDYPGLYEIRRLAETNLMDAVLISLENTASYVKDRGKALHPATIQTINWLRESQKRMSE